MKKQFTLVMLSEMIGKFIQIEGETTIVKGYIKGINKNASGLYDVKLLYGSHSFTEEQMATLYYEREVNGNIFLFDNEQDCINNIKFMRENASREVVSAENAHTTIDVWKQRWWDVFFELMFHGENCHFEYIEKYAQRGAEITRKSQENPFL